MSGYWEKVKVQDYDRHQEHNAKAEASVNVHVVFMFTLIFVRNLYIFQIDIILIFPSLNYILTRLTSNVSYFSEN